MAVTARVFNTFMVDVVLNGYSVANAQNATVRAMFLDSLLDVDEVIRTALARADLTPNEVPASGGYTTGGVDVPRWYAQDGEDYSIVGIRQTAAVDVTGFTGSFQHVAFVFINVDNNPARTLPMVLWSYDTVQTFSNETVTIPQPDHPLQLLLEVQSL